MASEDAFQQLKALLDRDPVADALRDLQQALDRRPRDANNNELFDRLQQLLDLLQRDGVFDRPHDHEPAAASNRAAKVQRAVRLLRVWLQAGDDREPP
jgi:hypothetical protein